MKTLFTHIYLQELPICNGTTSRWAVRNRKSNYLLGWIKWYGAWRRYCFFPLVDSVFSADCLADIQETIGALMAERKPA